MDLAKHSLKVMVSQLLPTDSICIIGFDSTPNVYFKSNSMTDDEKKRALASIETVSIIPHPRDNPNTRYVQMKASGGTNIWKALQMGRTEGSITQPLSSFARPKYALMKFCLHKCYCCV